ncbi:UDP-N-acetylglucosamine-peptide N-acetylglucosaminyltransferase, partial [Thraustotheca clavata]
FCTMYSVKVSLTFKCSISIVDTRKKAGIMETRKKPQGKIAAIPSVNSSPKSPEEVDLPTTLQQYAGRFSISLFLYDFVDLLDAAQHLYNQGKYKDGVVICDHLYIADASRTDNLLLLGALHFQLRNFSESIFYNQQCIRIEPHFAEAFGNLGNALKEIGDINGAVQFYLRAIKLNPRFADVYNNLASSYMQMGATREAIETYKMALVLDPCFVDAHSNLGNLYKAQGLIEEATECYTNAIRVKPTFAIAWNNFAGLLKDDGQLEKAIAHYKEAIRLAPDFADAYSNLGNALKESGQHAEAIEAYKKAIALRPEFAIAHGTLLSTPSVSSQISGNLAGSYFDANQVELAITTYRTAIQLEPNYPDAYNNLGNALREIGQLEQAISCYRTALRLKPDHPHAYNNLGNALKDKGMIKEAIHCYMTAARLMPRFAAAHCNLGSLLKEQGKIEQAVAHYQEAITIDPAFADAYSNMGNAYKDLLRLEEAIACYSTAIRLKPAFADTYSNLAIAYKDGGRLEEALTCFRKALSLRPDFPEAFTNYVHALAQVCDWRSRTEDFKKLVTILERQLRMDTGLPTIQPFHALIYPLSSTCTLEIAKRFAQKAKLNVSLVDMGNIRYRNKKSDERLKIGYISSNFGNHPLSHLMQSVFRLHDTTRFDITCYATSPSDQSKWRRTIENECEHFRDVSMMSNGDIAHLIYNDGIHILINLNGYTKGARNEIFALQPAPLQIACMNSHGTMGANYIHYVVADKTVVPQNCTSGFVESMIYMPHSFLVNDHKQSHQSVLDIETCPTRAQYDVPEDKFVFCNFSQLYKLDPVTFSTWMHILKRVPNSILWLLRYHTDDLVESNLIAEAKVHGIRESRIHFTNVAPKEEHLRRGYLADLFLDTPICNAKTVGCDILWSGTPMITLSGDTIASRVAASLLLAVDLPELIAKSMEEYEELAVALALDMDKLWEIRKKLEETRTTCPLFDTKRWVRNWESGLLLAWDAHESSSVNEHIEVPDIVELTSTPIPLSKETHAVCLLTEATMRLAPTTLAMFIATAIATPVSVCRDATYDISGSICVGAGKNPVGIACPRKGDKATKDCHLDLPSYDRATQTCVAIEDATCVTVNGDTWGCAFPSIPCGPPPPPPTAPVSLCSSNPQGTCSTWEYSEADIPSEINFDASSAPASWFVASTALPQFQAECLDGTAAKPLNPTVAPTQAPQTNAPTPQPSSAPTQAPTLAPTITPKPTMTPAPPSPTPESVTQAPATPAPTQAPTHAPATPAPTQAPTQAPATPAPTHAPTQAPATPAPTQAPTQAPATPAPTKAQTQAPCTPAPTPAPTQAPATPAPTKAQTQAPCTPAPTQAPCTPAPTEAQTQAPCTPAPAYPTQAPATPAPTRAPCTPAPTPEPTQAPCTATPTPAPTPCPNPAAL